MWELRNPPQSGGSSAEPHLPICCALSKASLAAGMKAPKVPSLPWQGKVPWPRWQQRRADPTELCSKRAAGESRSGTGPGRGFSGPQPPLFSALPAPVCSPDLPPTYPHAFLGAGRRSGQWGCDDPKAGDPQALGVHAGHRPTPSCARGCCSARGDASLAPTSGSLPFPIKRKFHLFCKEKPAPLPSQHNPNTNKFLSKHSRWRKPGAVRQADIRGAAFPLTGSKGLCFIHQA